MLRDADIATFQRLLEQSVDLAVARRIIPIVVKATFPQFDVITCPQFLWSPLEFECLIKTTRSIITIQQITEDLIKLCAGHGYRLIMLSRQAPYLTTIGRLINDVNSPRVVLNDYVLAHGVPTPIHDDAGVDIQIDNDSIMNVDYDVGDTIDAEILDPVLFKPIMQGNQATFLLHPGRTCNLKTKLAFDIPPHLCAILVLRSKWIKQDLIASVPLIDGGYTGPYSVRLYNASRKPIVITPGRYGQLVFLPRFLPSTLPTPFPVASSRGDKGHGSSG